MYPKTLSFYFQLDHYISSREKKKEPLVFWRLYFLSHAYVSINITKKHKYLLYTPQTVGVSLIYLTVTSCSDLCVWLPCPSSLFSPSVSLGKKVFILRKAKGWQRNDATLQMTGKALPRLTSRGRPPCPTSAQHRHFTQFTFHPKSGAPVYKEQREKQAVPWRIKDS